MGFLDGSYPELNQSITISTAEVAEEEQMKCKQVLASGDNRSNLSVGNFVDEVLGLVVGLDTAREMCNTIADSFSQ